MGDTTTRLALPYPVLTDQADVPSWVQDLAEALDLNVTIYSVGTYAARPTTGTAGMFYRATDTGAIYFWDTAWRDITTIPDNSITAAKLAAALKPSGTADLSTEAIRTAAGVSGTLASRPAASTAPGCFYYATDQDVLYLSTGSSWLRVGLPAGATTRVYSDSVPTGWIAYNGTALPGSTGIYADLYTALGGTTATPDTRERVLVSKGSHADVDALGDSDGLAYGQRSPVHNSTLAGAVGHNLGISRTADVVLSAVSHDAVKRVDPAGDPKWDQSNNHGTIAAASISVGVSQQPNFGLTGGVNNGNLSVGPGGTRPTDKPGYITFSVVLAKL